MGAVDDAKKAAADATSKAADATSDAAPSNGGFSLGGLFDGLLDEKSTSQLPSPVAPSADLNEVLGVVAEGDAPAPVLEGRKRGGFFSFFNPQNAPSADEAKDAGEESHLLTSCILHGGGLRCVPAPSLPARARMLVPCKSETWSETRGQPCPNLCFQTKEP